MATVSLDQRVRRADVLWRRAGDRILIRRRGDDELVVLADTGAALWETLAFERTVGAVAATLAEAHEAPVDVVASDVQEAVAELIDQRMVVVS